MIISAVILAKNEEKNIHDCIASVKFCNEIIVIDDESTDKTAQIAKKLGAKIIHHALASDFAKQRNFAMSQSKGDWILFIDADERVSKELAEEILEHIHTDTHTGGYYLQRRDHLFGKFLKHGETGNIELLRLAKKGTGLWAGKVHEVWVTKDNTETLHSPLLHYPHITVGDFLHDINFYSTLRAQELYEMKKHVTWWSIILYPKAKFIQNYFLRLGILDGVPGFILAAMMSFHSFLVRGKLWLLWENTIKEHQH